MTDFQTKAMECSPCHRQGFCLNSDDQSCGEGCECLGPITSALSAAYEQGKRDEREACAKWHDGQAQSARDSISCGCDNSERMAAHSTANHHASSAVAIRSRGEAE